MPAISNADPALDPIVQQSVYPGPSQRVIEPVRGFLHLVFVVDGRDDDRKGRDRDRAARTRAGHGREFLRQSPANRSFGWLVGAPWFRPKNLSEELLWQARRMT